MPITLIRSNRDNVMHGADNDRKTGCGIRLQGNSGVSTEGNMTDITDLTCDRCKEVFATKMIRESNREESRIAREERKRFARAKKQGIVTEATYEEYVINRESEASSKRDSKQDTSSRIMPPLKADMDDNTVFQYQRQQASQPASVSPTPSYNGAPYNNNIPVSNVTPQYQTYQPQSQVKALHSIPPQQMTQPVQTAPSQQSAAPIYSPSGSKPIAANDDFLSQFIIKKEDIPQEAAPVVPSPDLQKPLAPSDIVSAADDILSQFKVNVDEPVISSPTPTGDASSFYSNQIPLVEPQSVSPIENISNIEFNPNAKPATSSIEDITVPDVAPVYQAYSRESVMSEYGGSNFDQQSIPQQEPEAKSSEAPFENKTILDIDDIASGVIDKISTLIKKPVVNESAEAPVQTPISEFIPVQPPNVYEQLSSEQPVSVPVQPSASEFVASLDIPSEISEFILPPTGQTSASDFVASPEEQSTASKFITSPSMQSSENDFSVPPTEQSPVNDFITPPVMQSMESEFIVPPVMQPPVNDYAVPAAEQPPVNDFITPPSMQPPVNEYITPPSMQSSVNEFITPPSMQSPVNDFITPPSMQSPVNEYITPPSMQSPVNEYIKPPSTQSPVNEYITPPSMQSPVNEYITPPSMQSPVNEYIKPPSMQSPVNDFITPPSTQSPVNEYITPPSMQSSVNDFITPPSMQPQANDIIMSQVMQPNVPNSAFMYQQTGGYITTPVESQGQMSGYNPFGQNYDSVTQTYKNLNSATFQNINNMPVFSEKDDIKQTAISGLFGKINSSPMVDSIEEALRQLGADAGISDDRSKNSDKEEIIPDFVPYVPSSSKALYNTPPSGSTVTNNQSKRIVSARDAKKLAKIDAKFHKELMERGFNPNDNKILRRGK